MSNFEQAKEDNLNIKHAMQTPWDLDYFPDAIEELMKLDIRKHILAELVVNQHKDIHVVEVAKTQMRVTELSWEVWNDVLKNYETVKKEKEETDKRIREDNGTSI